MTKLICFFLSLTMVCTSCTTSQNEITKYRSGEELLRGIIFGEGEIGDKIPEVKVKITEKFNALSENEQQLANAQKEAIIALVKKQNPTFLADFKSKIDSKDYLKIQTALYEASDILMNASYEVNPTLNSKMTKTEFFKKVQDAGRNSRQESSYKYVQTDFVIALYVAIAVVVGLIIVFPARVNPIDPIFSNAPSDLSNEMIVNSIGSNL